MATNTIMIIDDEELNVELLVDLLEDAGYLTIAANNGEQALQKFVAAKPDLILLDVMMPVLDGYATAKQLRQLETENSQTPILFLSAKASQEDQLKGYEAGGDDYITKPFDNDELLVKVKATLSKQVISH